MGILVFMGEVLPLPNRGEVFLDPRGEGRSLRVSWHRDEHTLVLSMWQLGQCRATFRLPTEDVPELVRALVAGLSDGLARHRDAHQQLSRLLEPAISTQPTPPSWNREPVVQPTVGVAKAEPPTVAVAVAVADAVDADAVVVDAAVDAATEPNATEPAAAAPAAEEPAAPAAETEKPAGAEKPETPAETRAAPIPPMVFKAPPEPA